MKTIPKSSNAELSALISRNFSPASDDRSSRSHAMRAAAGSDVNSSATYIVINSRADASSIIPVSEKSIRATNSPLNPSNRSWYFVAARKTSAATPTNRIWKKRANLSTTSAPNRPTLSSGASNHRMSVNISGAASPRMATPDTSRLSLMTRSITTIRPASTAIAIWGEIR